MLGICETVAICYFSAMGTCQTRTERPYLPINLSVLLRRDLSRLNYFVMSGRTLQKQTGNYILIN